MSALELRQEWIDEAKKWDVMGDPTPDPSIDPKVAAKELAEKQILLTKLNISLFEKILDILSELTGIDKKKLKVATGAGAAALVTRAGAKHGDEVKAAFEEAINEEIGSKESDDIDDSGKRTRRKFNVKKDAKGVIGRLRDKLIKKAGVAGLIYTIATLVTVGILYREYDILKKKIETLHKAMRWEALEIDPNSDPPDIDYWYNPPAGVAKKLGGKPPCRLFLKVIYRWIDGKTGEKKSHEMREVQVTGSRTRSHGYEKNLPVKTSGSVCFLVAEMSWSLHCDTTPPTVTDLGTSYLHIRTSANSSKVRGSLPFD